MWEKESGVVVSFLISLLGSMVAIWIVTRIIYLFTSKLDKKPQAGLALVIGITLITTLTSIEWFTIESSLLYYLSLILWFILDFTGVTNKRVDRFRDISDIPNDSGNIKIL